VKVRYNDRDEGQCSESLREPTDLESDAYSFLPKLLKKSWSRRVSLRMVSLKLSNVYDGRFRSELSLEGNARNLDAGNVSRQPLTNFAATRDGLLFCVDMTFVCAMPPETSSSNRPPQS